MQKRNLTVWLLLTLSSLMNATFHNLFLLPFKQHHHLILVSACTLSLNCNFNLKCTFLVNSYVDADDCSLNKFSSLKRDSDVDEVSSLEYIKPHQEVETTNF